MVVSKMKKLTLLGEKEYLKSVMLSLQSFQAIELIPTPADIQRGLINQFHNVTEEDSDDVELPSDNHIFDNPSNEREINRLTHLLDDVEESIEFLEDVVPSPSFLEKLRFEKETYSLYVIEEKVEALNISNLLQKSNDLRQRIDQLKEEREKLEEERSFLYRWRTLNFNPSLTKDFEITEVLVGAIDSERNDDLREALSHFAEIYIEELNYTEEETIYLIITSQREAHDIEQTLIRHRFERLDYKYNQLPEEELKRNKKQLNDITSKIEKIDDSPEEYKQLLMDLKIAEEYLFNTRERIRAAQDILISENLFVLTGWIEENIIDKQVKAIEKTVGEDKLLKVVQDVQESEKDSVPIKLQNRKSTSAFENVVTMYSVPKYGEMDPTPFVQPFSILFFGMMTADAGYGLLGLIAIFIALKFFNVPKELRKNLEFFGQLMIGTTLAGLFFGSFFGFDLPFKVMSLSDQLLEIMVLSMGIGFVHLILGLFLNTIINNRKKNYAESYTSGYSWILILIASLVIALNAFFAGPAMITTIAIVVTLLSLAVSVIINIISNENKIEGTVNGVFSLFDVTGYIGDIISYTRLTALGVASANIGMAFNLVIGLLPPIARFTVGILIFVGLHLFNMFIAMISGYVHTLRLNYVEFFGKFYQGGGREFEPIPLLQKHVLIENNVEE